MSEITTVKNTDELVEAIVNDVRRQGLQVGDKYLTAKEVGERFQTSTVTAHRAMSFLSDNGTLIRKRKSGTFIGPGFVRNPEAGADVFHSVHVIMDKTYSQSAPLMFEVFSEAMAKCIPDGALQFHVTPNEDSYLFSRRIVEQIEKSDYREGLILIRSSERVQALVADSGIPAIIYGSSYPGINLPSLDVDHIMLGRLITQKLIDLDCKQFVLIQRGVWRRGDNELFNSICRTLGDASFPMGSLQVYNISGRSELPKLELMETLKYSQGNKVGVICGNNWMGDQLHDFIQEENLGENVIEIASCGLNPSGDLKPYIQATPVENYSSQVNMILNYFAEYDTEKESHFSRSIAFSLVK